MKLGAITLLAAFSRSVIASVSQAAPGCVSKCWENSKYVTTCRSGEQCLCRDADFQSTVLQCLYSQCHTAQFGSALHHALSKCAQLPSTNAEDPLPLLRHRGLRKRALQNQPLASVNVRPLVSAHQAFASVAYVVQSAPRRFAGVSGAANYARPTRSVNVNLARTSITVLSTATALPSGLDDVGFNESLAPSGARTGSDFPSQTALASVISGFGVGGTEPHVRVEKEYVVPSGAPSFPIRSGLNSTTPATNFTSATPTPTATPPSFGSVGFYYPDASNASASLTRPSASSSGYGSNTSTPFKKTRRTP